MIDYFVLGFAILMVGGLYITLFIGTGTLSWIALIGGGLSFIICMAVSIYLKTTEGTP